MTTRLNAYAVAPQGVQKMIELEELLKNSGLEYSLYELVKMRASQINGCAYCLHMHSKDARAAGETEDRLHLLVAWRESSLYTPRERAALAWTESLTNLAQTGAPDADYDGLKEHFTEVEIVNLTLLIGLINSWNRMAVGLRSQHPKTWNAAAKAA
jgi:AhpD family alkylhydroperoxidase